MSYAMTLTMSTRTALIGLFTTALLAFSTQSYASDNNYTNVQIDQCRMQMTGDLTFIDGVLTINTQQGQSLTIDEVQRTSINGVTVDLNTSQKSAIESYYYNIKASIPMGVEIAAQGLEIGALAVNEVLAPLIGEDDPLIIKLNELFNGIATGLENDIVDENGNLYLSQSQQRDWLSTQWQQEFDSVLNHTIQDNMGRLMMAIGKAILFGDDTTDITAFDPGTLMSQVDEKMQLHAQALETAVTSFCDIVKAAEQAERKLQASGAEFKDFTYLSVSPIEPVQPGLK